jgi:tRNA A58 N-methylase Trm61
MAGTVCEIGAGDGEMSIAAARIVGPNGRVYSSELGDARIKKLRDNVAARGLTQITVVAGDPTRTNFPDGACDGVFMRDVYHHVTDPASMNSSISAALKPGGRVAVIDFSPGGKEADRPAGRAGNGSHGVYSETVVREMKDGGFEFVSSELPAQRWFMVVVSKPKG